MTTIGYGDVAPATGFTKFVLCIFALIGAGFIAMPAVSVCSIISLAPIASFCGTLLLFLLYCEVVLFLFIALVECSVIKPVPIPADSSVIFLEALQTS